MARKEKKILELWIAENGRLEIRVKADHDDSGNYFNPSTADIVKSLCKIIDTDK